MTQLKCSHFLIDLRGSYRRNFSRHVYSFFDRTLWFPSLSTPEGSPRLSETFFGEFTTLSDYHHLLTVCETRYHSVSRTTVTPPLCTGPSTFLCLSWTTTTPPLWDQVQLRECVSRTTVIHSLCTRPRTTLRVCPSDSHHTSTVYKTRYHCRSVSHSVTTWYSAVIKRPKTTRHGRQIGTLTETDLVVVSLPPLPESCFQTSSNHRPYKKSRSHIVDFSQPPLTSELSGRGRSRVPLDPSDTFNQKQNPHHLSMTSQHSVTRT